MSLSSIRTWGWFPRNDAGATSTSIASLRTWGWFFESVEAAVEFASLNNIPMETLVQVIGINNIPMEVVRELLIFDLIERPTDWTLDARGTDWILH